MGKITLYFLITILVIISLDSININNIFSYKLYIWNSNNYENILSLWIKTSLIVKTFNEVIL